MGGSEGDTFGLCGPGDRLMVSTHGDAVTALQETFVGKEIRIWPEGVYNVGQCKGVNSLGVLLLRTGAKHVTFIPWTAINYLELM